MTLILKLNYALLQFKSRKEDRERKGSIPYHHQGKKRQRRMGVPFLLHEDHLDVSPTRSTFSFGSFSGIGEDRRTIEKGGWQTTILGEFGCSWFCILEVSGQPCVECRLEITVYFSQPPLFTTSKLVVLKWGGIIRKNFYTH